jgi:hypothetical protein
MRTFAARIAAPQQQPPRLGKKWLRGFLVKNPEIHSVRSRQMHFSRVNGATTAIIRPWFNLLRLPVVLKVKPENRHNADEGGIAEGAGSNGIVLGPEGRKLVTRKSNGGKVWTSFLEWYLCHGQSLPSTYYLQGKECTAAMV